ncbi:unnamed protein product [Hymenolepis diminuta]|uniref:Ovule protein n=1 Tax=Hymenolepis diminuta TaxID=6216 RepID=A0A0R3SBJ9_HYMDI|nr:unnamed protein product [Hymenolepis diminuta]
MGRVRGRYPHTIDESLSPNNHPPFLFFKFEFPSPKPLPSSHASLHHAITPSSSSSTSSPAFIRRQSAVSFVCLPPFGITSRK